MSIAAVGGRPATRPRRSTVALRRALAGLSPSVEFWLIVTIAFGRFAVDAVVTFVTTGGRGVLVPDAGVPGLVLEEALAALVVAAILSARAGVRPGPLIASLRPSWGGTSLGLVLFLVTSVTSIALWLWAGPLVGEPDPWPDGSVFDEPPTPVTRFATASLLALVNPLYEEVLVVGYVMRIVGATSGTPAAIVASASLRALYHAYQGIVGVADLFLYGLAHATLYARTGRLWPLVLAHAVANFVGLALPA